jgi:hypothetical protein
MVKAEDKKFACVQAMQGFVHVSMGEWSYRATDY